MKNTRRNDTLGAISMGSMFILGLKYYFPNGTKTLWRKGRSRSMKRTIKDKHGIPCCTKSTEILKQ
jgi:hypothetical protein